MATDLENTAPGFNAVFSPPPPRARPVPKAQAPKGAAAPATGTAAHGAHPEKMFNMQFSPPKHKGRGARAAKALARGARPASSQALPPKPWKMRGSGRFAAGADGAVQWPGGHTLHDGGGDAADEEPTTPAQEHALDDKMALLEQYENQISTERSATKLILQSTPGPGPRGLRTPVAGTGPHTPDEQPSPNLKVLASATRRAQHAEAKVLNLAESLAEARTELAQRKAEAQSKQEQLEALGMLSEEQATHLAIAEEEIDALGEEFAFREAHESEARKRVEILERESNIHLEMLNEAQQAKLALEEEFEGFRASRADADGMVHQLQQDLAGAEAKLAASDAAKAAIEEELAGLRDEWTEVVEVRAAAMDAEIAKLLGEAETARAEVVQLRDALHATEATMTDSQAATAAEAVALQGALTDKNAAIADITNAKEACDAQLTDAQEALATARAEATQLEEALRAAETERQEAQVFFAEEAAALTEALAEKDAAIAELTRMASIDKEQYTAAQDILAAVQAENATLQAEGMAAAAGVEELQADASQAAERVVSLEKQLVDAVAGLADLRSQVAAAGDQATRWAVQERELQIRCVQLEERASARRNAEDGLEKALDRAVALSKDVAQAECAREAAEAALEAARAEGTKLEELRAVEQAVHAELQDTAADLDQRLLAAEEAQAVAAHATEAATMARDAAQGEAEDLREALAAAKDRAADREAHARETEARLEGVRASLAAAEQSLAVERQVSQKARCASESKVEEVVALLSKTSQRELEVAELQRCKADGEQALEQTAAALKEAKAEAAELTEQMRSTEAEMARVAAKRDEATEELQRAQNFTKKLETKLVAQDEALIAAEENQGLIRSMEHEGRALEERVAELLSHRVDAEKATAALHAENHDLRAQLELLGQEVDRTAETAGTVEVLQEENALLRAAISQLRTEADRASEVQASLVTDVEVLRAARDTLTQENAALAAAKDVLSEQYTRQAGVEEDLSQRVEALDGELSAARVARAAFEERLERMQGAQAAALAEARAMTSKLAAVEDTNAALTKTSEEDARARDEAMGIAEEALAERERASQQLRRLQEELAEAREDMARGLRQREADREELRRSLVQQQETGAEEARSEAQRLAKELARETSAAEEWRERSEYYQERMLKAEAEAAALSSQALEWQTSSSAAASAAETAQVRGRQLEAELASAKQLAESSVSEARRLETRVSTLQRRSYRADALRAALHNKVLQLKGNIRVFVRARPLLSTKPSDAVCLGEGNEERRTSGYRFPASDVDDCRNIEVFDLETNRGGLGDRRKRWRFGFDRVFGPDASQGDVYREVAPLVQSAVDGHRVCVFAFGQTGSGKTHTVFGPEAHVATTPVWSSPPERRAADSLLGLGVTAGSKGGNAGLVLRTLRHVFAATESLEEQGWAWEVTVQVLEVYNEQIFDLLNGSAQPLGLRHTAPKEVPEDVQEKSRGLFADVFLEGATSFVVADATAAAARVADAVAQRTVRATKSNADSSRSHCVVTVALEGHHARFGLRRAGRLHLVDLAGSERLHKSGSGDVDLAVRMSTSHNQPSSALKEAQAINASLSALGSVMAALKNRDAHVPFRNSVLTHLLQGCLGGKDAKALMLCCLAPERSHMPESLCSLRFARKVAGCLLGEGPALTQA